MPHFFDISFPFAVTDAHYDTGDYPPLCAYTIPLAETTVYQNQEMPGFEFARQYYGNKLISVDLFDCKSPQPFDLRIKQKMRPAFVLVIMLLGYFSYYDAVRREVAKPVPGSVYMARMAGKQYRIRVPEKESRLLLVTVHPSQLAVMGEDFAALSDLLDGHQANDYYISPYGRADEKLMRRLIKLLTPTLKRRKDFNKHLQNQLPEVMSCLKGLMQGKNQESLDQKKFGEIKAYIQAVISSHQEMPLMATIAREHNIDTKKLQRLFLIDKTNYRAYVHQQTLQHALALVTETELSFLEIALFTGYNDEPAFLKAFLKYYGHYPGYYRA